jgi:hypothetical protein
LASIDAEIYHQAIELLHDVDEPVVANLLVDILNVLTAFTINVKQFKHLLRYLKTENQIWVGRIIMFDVVR